MVSRNLNQQGTSPDRVDDVGNAQDDGAQSRFPGAAFCWRLMFSMKPNKTREQVARWSFRFASKCKRGTARTYRKEETQTDLDVIDEERNIVADRFVLNPPTNNLNQMAAHITPQKLRAPEPMPIGPTGIKWDRIPTLNPDALRKKIQTEGGQAQERLFEEQERRRANHKYWQDMAKKRKREEEDAQWGKAEEERIKRAARIKTNPFARLYIPKPKTQRQQQQQQSTPQVSRTQIWMQTSRIQPPPRLMPSRIQNGQPHHMNLRSGRMVVTNGGNIHRWKCAVCRQTTACTRHHISWKGNYEMVDLCLVCEMRKNRGEVLNYVEDNFSDFGFDDNSSSTTNTDTSSDSDCVMNDVVDVYGQNNAQPAAAGGVDVQIQVDGATVNADDPVVPNVQQNVQPPVAVVPVAPTPGYLDMFWTNNPLRQLMQQVTSIDYSAILRIVVFGEPYLQVNVDQQKHQEQQEQQEQNVQPAEPVEVRQIARPRQRRVQPPRQARAAQAAQATQAGPAPRRQKIAVPLPGGIRRARAARQVPRVDPNDPRLFFGFLA
ncbi:hypothetical protein Sste5346_007936 [Sporothrix stenoceras]|uniref:Uncharacterized protein n=1 Tax=Sporothrix stenoceras TaxID=5173 RepID=A0ABR3YSL3_9PEZI